MGKNGRQADRADVACRLRLDDGPKVRNGRDKNYSRTCFPFLLPIASCSVLPASSCHHVRTTRERGERDREKERERERGRSAVTGCLGVSSGEADLLPSSCVARRSALAPNVGKNSAHVLSKKQQQQQESAAGSSLPSRLPCISSLLLVPRLTQHQSPREAQGSQMPEEGKDRRSSADPPSLSLSLSLAPPPSLPSSA